MGFYNPTFLCRVGHRQVHACIVCQNCNPTRAQLIENTFVPLDFETEYGSVLPAIIVVHCKCIDRVSVYSYAIGEGKIALFLSVHISL